MTTTGERGTAGSRNLRDVAVFDDLSELCGPVDGVQRLPLHLHSSAPETFDFADPHRRALAYRIVLGEASNIEDLTAWLNRGLLLEEWPTLYLPRRVRRVWQEHHPELAARGAGPDVPAA